MKKYGVRVFAVALCLTVGGLVAIVRLSLAFRERPLLASREPDYTEQSSEAEEAVSEILAGEILGDAELAYHGYVVQKGLRKARLDSSLGPSERTQLVEVSYAILKRRGRVLGTFDADVYSGLGNSTRFGLFSFLGSDEKQLFVSQDVSRGGNQWIVSLSPQLRIIYDSSEFKAGREGDDIRIIDLDRDGVYEIIQPITAFYGFSEWIPTGLTPLPAVIFKYDTKAKKYLPANRRFQDYLLRDIVKAKKKITGAEDRIYHVARIIPVVLDYIFAGKELEAWAFYEESYKLPDKVTVKQRIKKILRKHPVYRFIYRKNRLAKDK